MRQCRICGCTEHTPCVAGGETCAWIAEDLCDFCDVDAEIQEADSLVEIYSEGDLNRAIAARRRGEIL